MDENLHNIEDLFHSALDANEETASANVWDNVEKQLDKDNIVSIKGKYVNAKRIALLLLFLLVSFVLFDVYKTNTSSHGNGFVKKADSNSDSNRQVNNETNVPANEKNRNSNTEIVPDKNLAPENNNQDNVGITPADNNIPETKDQIMPFLNQKNRQKKNILNVFNSDKNISDNQIVITDGQKKKRSTKSLYRVKIKNALPTEDDQLLAEDNADKQDNKVPALKRLSTISIEKTPLLFPALTDTKKIAQLITPPKIKTADTSSNTIAKATKKKVSKPSRFSITPFFSPDIAWYRLQDDKLDNQPDNARELEKEERHEFSSTYGALIDYKLNKHWGLQSGISLSNTNITVDPKTIYAQQDNTGGVKYRINTSSGYGYVLPSFSSNPAVGDSLYAFTSTHSLQYVNIPLAATYSVTKGKVTVKAIAGVSTNILTKAKLEATVEKGFNNSVETVNNIEGLKKVYFSGLAGLGVDYKLTKKTSVVFAPAMRFALNSINKNATVKSYPMALGFTVGLKIGL